NVVNNLSTLLHATDAAGIPVFGSEIEQVRNGCVASESLDYVALGKETGLLAARVLGGEDPGKIPVSKIQDSFPCYNPDVLARFSLTLPEAYASAQAVTAQ
ncbi:MAG TPA: ABC transporter substrate binding protein, partial [Clostridia bacterium]|nr:ABC transporter substrate binding protein [Clostridia bacterium]